MLARLRNLVSHRHQYGIPKAEIARHVGDAPVVVDAGAFNGVDSLEMAKLWPTGIIHAFEPVPSAFAQLEALTGSRSNVRRYQCALGAEVGSTSMFVSAGPYETMASSLLPPKEHLVDVPDVTFGERVVVEVTTLDAWAQAQGISRVDVLWLDMQGYELAVMKASPRIMAGVRAIALEVLLNEGYEGAPLRPEVEGWLHDAGFRTVLAQDDGLQGELLLVR